MEPVVMKLLIAAVALALAGTALAQHHHQPYAGHQKRSVKAISAEQEANLKAGRGMGLALAAELNGYPGPMHALELSAKISLSAEQHRNLSDLYNSMKTEAIAAGARLIESERQLDQAFATGKINPEILTRLTARIGENQAALRAVHLKYHLITADLLDATQRQKYAELRGYHLHK
jgi:hypothetical protein